MKHLVDAIDSQLEVLVKLVDSPYIFSKVFSEGIRGVGERVIEFEDWMKCTRVKLTDYQNPENRETIEMLFRYPIRPSIVKLYKMIQLVRKNSLAGKDDPDLLLHTYSQFGVVCGNMYTYATLVNWDLFKFVNQFGYENWVRVLATIAIGLSMPNGYANDVFRPLATKEGKYEYCAKVIENMNGLIAKAVEVTKEVTGK